MPNTILVSPYETLPTIKLCSVAARHIRLTSLTNDFQQSAYKRIFCVFGLTISEDWSRFVLIAGGTKKGHCWMQTIAETVGEFVQGDWGRSRLITGGKVGGHYCNTWLVWFNSCDTTQPRHSRWHCSHFGLLCRFICCKEAASKINGLFFMIWWYFT